MVFVALRLKTPLDVSRIATSAIVQYQILRRPAHFSPSPLRMLEAKPIFTLEACPRKYKDSYKPQSIHFQLTNLYLHSCRTICELFLVTLSGTPLTPPSEVPSNLHSPRHLRFRPITRSPRWIPPFRLHRPQSKPLHTEPLHYSQGVWLRSLKSGEDDGVPDGHEEFRGNE